MTNDNKSPTHIVFAVIEPEGRTSGRDDSPKAHWIKLGAAWENQDGSVSCLLDAFPLAWNAGFRGKFKLVLQVPRDDRQPENRDSRRGSGNQGNRR